ncbi:uL30 family ribosomal protein [Streptomyces luteogriseus]|uniref:hypothetical protein n=1 Tax=Streptomyces luteogriseus TaxID=68233 RepID=UPI003712DD26
MADPAQTDEHHDPLASSDIWGALKAAAQQRSDLANAARARRDEKARIRREAQQSAARKAELDRIKAEAEEEASTYRPEGPLCRTLYHDSRGNEVFCGLHQGHEEDDPTCDAGNGVTWPHYED